MRRYLSSFHHRAARCGFLGTQTRLLHMNQVSDQVAGLNPQRGARGSRRGRWNGRGNSTGRGGKLPKEPRDPRERPTHFISVPLDHLEGFTTQVGHMGGALLNISPTITGLDRSIVISPNRLHLTLGVMALNQPSQKHTNDDSGSVRATRAPATITDALDLLHQLKPEVQRMLNDQPLQLTLDELTVMRRTQAGEADVLYFGPSNELPKSDEHVRGVAVLHMVHNRFRGAGFITEHRPLKLHCTVINTSHRRSGGRSGPRGVPFSISEVERAITLTPSITGNLLSAPGPLAVRELKLCRMGSRDEQGRYVREGGIEW